MEYAHFLLDLCNTAERPQALKEECAAELFGLYLDRTAVAWQLQQKVTLCPHMNCNALLSHLKDVAVSVS